MPRVVKSGPETTPKLFYGWWIVFAGFIVQLLNGGLLLQAFGAYFVHLQAEFGWSRSVLSGVFSLTRAESGILGPFQGWMIDRFGPRILMRVGIALFGVGFMALGQVNSILSFYVIFGLIAVGSSLGGFLTINASIVNWFFRKRARAMALMATGMGVGGMAVPGVAWTLNTIGWRATAFWSGVIILVVGLAAAQVMRHAPEPYGLRPDGDAAPDGANGAGHDGSFGDQAGGDASGFTAREALKTSAFWLISLGHGSALLVVSAVMVHLIPHLVERLGLRLEAAGAVVSVLTLVMIVGQLVGGILGDRFDKRVIAIVCMMGHTVALLTLVVASSLPLVMVFAVLHGLSWGVRGPLMMAIRADYFGRRSFATIMGFSSLVVMMGMMTGPLFAGFMADRLGDYRMGFAILAVMTGLGAIFFAAARPPAQPIRLRATTDNVASPDPVG